jgi:FtsH-binding integral membrane protein
MIKKSSKKIDCEIYIEINQLTNMYSYNDWKNTLLFRNKMYFIMSVLVLLILHICYIFYYLILNNMDKAILYLMILFFVLILILILLYMIFYFILDINTDISDIENGIIADKKA